MLFRDFADKFLEVSAAVGNSPGELAQKRMCVTNHLVPFFGDYDMEDLFHPEVRAYTELKRSEGKAANTIANHLGIFSRFLSVAREERALTTPPWPVKKSRAETNEACWLDASQRAALLRASALEGGEVDAMIRFVLATGLRIGEVRALLRTSIDPQRKFVTVRASYDRSNNTVKTTKNKVVHAVPLGAEARAALTDVPLHGQATVFTLTYDQAHTALARIVKSAGLAKCGWHTLRHTFATTALERGLSLFAVSRLLGHKSIGQTEKYAHFDPATAAAALA